MAKTIIKKAKKVSTKNISSKKKTIKSASKKHTSLPLKTKLAKNKLVKGKVSSSKSLKTKNKKGNVSQKTTKKLSSKSIKSKPSKAINKDKNNKQLIKGSAKSGVKLDKKNNSVKLSANKQKPIKSIIKVVEEPKKRGRPPKLVDNSQITQTETLAGAQEQEGPKKRGRKSKAEVLAASQLSNGHLVSSTGVPLGQPIKRKRGRPRKNEQYGATSADLTSELMTRGIRKFGVPFGRSNVPVARYSWSAETGEHLESSTANFSSAESGVEAIYSKDVEFSKGDQVVYPAHGLGIIQAIQSRLVGGAQQKFYMISIVETGMKIMVPVSQSKTVGLRQVVDHSTVDRVYAILKDKNVAIDNQTWNRRYREYSQKIKTGSVLEIASVIRDLTVLKVEKELSFNERRMLDTAQGLLVKELSIAKSASEDLIKEELEQICQI